MAFHPLSLFICEVFGGSLGFAITQLTAESVEPSAHGEERREKKIKVTTQPLKELFTKDTKGLSRQGNTEPPNGNTASASSLAPLLSQILS